MENYRLRLILTMLKINWDNLRVTWTNLTVSRTNFEVTWTTDQIGNVLDQMEFLTSHTDQKYVDCHID